MNLPSDNMTICASAGIAFGANAQPRRLALLFAGLTFESYPPTAYNTRR